MPSAWADNPAKKDLPELVQPFDILLWIIFAIDCRIILDGQFDSAFWQAYAPGDLLPNLDQRQVYPMLKALHTEGWLSLADTEFRLTRKTYFWYRDTHRPAVNR